MKIGPFNAYRHDLGGYMERWILVHPWGMVRLHHILRADADRELHTHPFDFLSLILRGGYTEETPAPGEPPHLGCGRTTRTFRAPSWNASTGAAPHRLSEVRPGTWTLVFCGPRVREWGFWDVAGFCHWQEFTSVKPYDKVAYKATVADVSGGTP